VLNHFQEDIKVRTCPADVVFGKLMLMKLQCICHVFLSW